MKTIRQDKLPFDDTESISASSCDVAGINHSWVDIKDDRDEPHMNMKWCVLCEAIQ